MPSPLAEAFLMGIFNGCYETPSKSMHRVFGLSRTIKYLGTSRKVTIFASVLRQI